MVYVASDPLVRSGVHKVVEPLRVLRDIPCALGLVAFGVRLALAEVENATSRAAPASPADGSEYPSAFGFARHCRWRDTFVPPRPCAVGAWHSRCSRDAMRICGRGEKCLLLGIVLVTIFTTACAEDDAVSNDESAIQGGAVESGFDAVGLLHFDGTGDDFCTGTLISPNVVLTAGHCVSRDGEDRTIDGFYTGAGTAVPYENDSEWWTSMKHHSVKAMAAHPRYSSSTCSEDVVDVALVWLETPIADIVPARRSKKSPIVGTQCKAVGFGDNSLNADGDRIDTLFGEKRSALVRVSNVTNARVFVDKVTGIPDPGDSGGPLFCDGVIVGVDSCGVDNGGSGPEHTRESFGSVDAANAWIKEQLAAHR